jgi:hypothetical protein
MLRSIRHPKSPVIGPNTTKGAIRLLQLKTLRISITASKNRARITKQTAFFSLRFAAIDSGKRSHANRSFRNCPGYSAKHDKAGAIITARIHNEFLAGISTNITLIAPSRAQSHLFTKELISCFSLAAMPSNPRHSCKVPNPAADEGCRISRTREAQKGSGGLPLVRRYRQFGIKNGQSRTEFLGRWDYLGRTMQKTPAQIHAARIIANGTGQFQKTMDAETEDGKHQILSALLAVEFMTHRTKPLKTRLYPLPNLR